jgi:hypothetical protein
VQLVTTAVDSTLNPFFRPLPRFDALSIIPSRQGKHQRQLACNLLSKQIACSAIMAAQQQPYPPPTTTTTHPPKPPPLQPGLNLFDVMCTLFLPVTHTAQQFLGEFYFNFPSPK